MAQRITIPHITRIEGHGKITIHLDDQNQVTKARFHVTQIRGFERFVQGRPYYEMPAITARICGICPVSHLLASSKACDALLAVRIPPAARRLRELLHYGQFVQSHALSFFHLSSPDLILGFDSDPAQRNVAGLLAADPELGRDGIALRRFGQQIIERLGGERVHPAWTVPGGVSSPLSPDDRDYLLGELPIAHSIAKRTLKRFKEILDRFTREIEAFGTTPTMYAGLNTKDGLLALYDGIVRFIEPDGKEVERIEDPLDYGDSIAEASQPDSYLKAPYFRPRGVDKGLYRVGPLARLNVAEQCGTPEADVELAEFRQRAGRYAHSSFYYHYARLVEALFAIEKIAVLLDNSAILDRHVRAHAGVNALEGVGIVEAPRGLLIHHYVVDEDGAMRNANLIVATGHNNLAIGHSVAQVAKEFVHGAEIKEGMTNRVQAVVRAYDPCLSCSTHALGMDDLPIEIVRG